MEDDPSIIPPSTTNWKPYDPLFQNPGIPDDIRKFGPLEKWTYNASDGSVIFIITGDSVAMQATAGKQNKNP